MCRVGAFCNQHLAVIAKKQKVCIKRNRNSHFACKTRRSSSASSDVWQCRQCSRMRWRSPEPPLPSSAGHINPAGLCLYGSPAHTSVMRVNKQRAKGQLSPQNKRGHRGKKRWEERRAARGSAQITVRASSRE